MAWTETEIRQALREFITKELMRDRDYKLDDDEKLFTTRRIDSFALAELGVYIERQFEVYIPDADLTSANMDTVAMIASRLSQELAQGE